MPKEEAGFAGYYLQRRVVAIVVIWIGPTLLLCLATVAQWVWRPPAWVTWLLLILMLALYLISNRLFNTVDSLTYSWRTGRDGEWAVREALSEHLDDDFYLLNDVVLPGRRGNIDHIVIGPCGLYTIETKSVIGEVDATSDRLRINGYVNKKYIESAKRDQEALRAYLKKRLPGESRTYPVYPVIVFTRASDVQSKGTTSDVSVEDIAGLLHLLDKYASVRRLDEIHRAQVFRALVPHVASAGKRVIPAIGT